MEGMKLFAYDSNSVSVAAGVIVTLIGCVFEAAGAAGEAGAGEAVADIFSGGQTPSNVLGLSPTSVGKCRGRKI